MAKKSAETVGSMTGQIAQAMAKADGGEVRADPGGRLAEETYM
jgi:hypothetical protein